MAKLPRKMNWKPPRLKKSQAEVMSAFVRIVKILDELNPDQRRKVLEAVGIFEEETQ